jgi:hypothetical protein
MALWFKDTVKASQAVVQKNHPTSLVETFNTGSFSRLAKMLQTRGRLCFLVPDRACHLQTSEKHTVAELNIEP